MNEESKNRGKDLPEGTSKAQKTGFPIWSDIATAFLFLSRLPMPYYGKQLSQAAWAFPIVGWFVGLLGAGVFVLATLLGLTGWLAALLALGTTIMVTGALHEDGFCDMADGFWGGQTVEKRLAIMRDSTIGAYGAIALILNLGLRAGALASLYNPALIIVVMVAAHGLGRASMAVAMAALKPAGQSGMAATAGKVHPLQAGLALVLGGVVFLAFIPQQAAIFLFLIPVAVGLIFVQIMKAKLGGYNGDSLGALCQLVEIATYLAVVGVGNTLGFSLQSWLLA